MRWVVRCILIAALLLGVPAHAALVSGSSPTLTFVINNAPAWAQSHAYVVGDRVVAGPAFAHPSTFTSGLELDAYKQTAATCTSLGSGNGPTGHGSAVSDNNCTWQYLYTVDYRFINSAAFDNAAWVTGTAYLKGDYVISDQASGAPKAYREDNTSCTTGATAPTGTGTSTPGDGCSWLYQATVGYSSQRGYLPTQRWLSGYTGHAPTVYVDRNYNYLIGFGGTASAGREYSIANGDAVNIFSTIVFFDHMDFNTRMGGGEQQPVCSNGNQFPKCTAASKMPFITLKPYPGEGFQDNPNVRTNALAYNAANGVAIRGTATHNVGPFGIGQGAGLWLEDSTFYVTGLQVKSDDWGGIEGTPNGGWDFVFGNIVDAGDDVGIAVDNCGSIGNNLVVQRSTSSTNGVPAGIVVKYGPMGVFNNTIVYVSGSPVTNATGIVLAASDSNGAVLCSFNGGSSYGNIPYFQNNMVVGWTNQVAYRPTDVAGISNANMIGNATDGSNSTTSPLFGVKNYLTGQGTGDKQGAVLGGIGNTCAGSSSCFNLTAANQFIDPATDFREKSTADIKGAGVAFSGTTVIFTQGIDNILDVSGTRRPGAALNYDAGAWNLP